MRWIAPLVLLGTLAHAQDTAPPTLEGRLQVGLDTWREAAGFPGACLSLRFEDGHTIELATGSTDREGEHPMEPASRMLAGSVGKTFHAALALQLVADEKLRLDAKISEYLGKEEWFARLPNAHDITVRMLMNHTSGLVRYELGEAFLTEFRAAPLRRWTVPEQLAFLLDTEAPFAAGEGWTYSDTNYLVLGLILVKLGDAPLHEQISKRLLEPLELKDTHPQLGPAMKGLVAGWAGPGNPFGSFDAVLEADGKLCFDPSFEGAGGGYLSTTSDLARWVEMYFTGAAFSKELLPQVLEGEKAPMLGPGARYGLGAILREHASLGPVAGHAGFFPGYVSEMAWYAEHRCAASLQINTSDFAKIRRRTSAALDGFVEIALESRR